MVEDGEVDHAKEGACEGAARLRKVAVGVVGVAAELARHDLKRGREFFFGMYVGALFGVDRGDGGKAGVGGSWVDGERSARGGTLWARVEGEVVLRLRFGVPDKRLAKGAAEVGVEVFELGEVGEREVDIVVEDVENLDGGRGRS